MLLPPIPDIESSLFPPPPNTSISRNNDQNSHRDPTNHN